MEGKGSHRTEKSEGMEARKVVKLYLLEFWLSLYRCVRWPFYS